MLICKRKYLRKQWKSEVEEEGYNKVAIDNRVGTKPVSIKVQKLMGSQLTIVQECYRKFRKCLRYILIFACLIFVVIYYSLFQEAVNIRCSKNSFKLIYQRF